MKRWLSQSALTFKNHRSIENLLLLSTSVDNIMVGAEKVLPHLLGTYLVQSCVSCPFSCPHGDPFSFSARMEFKTNILRALHEGFLMPNDEAGLKANFDLRRVGSICKANKEQVMATFKDVATAYVEWYRDPSVPMEIEAGVFAGAIGMGDEVKKESKETEVQSTSAFQAIPGLVPDLVHPVTVNQFSESNEIVFLLQTLSDQSHDGLDKMEELINKVSEVVEKITQLTNEADSTIGNPLEEMDGSSDKYTEETFPKSKKKKGVGGPI